MRFNVGDWTKCINNDNSLLDQGGEKLKALTIGKRYKVLGATICNNIQLYITIVDDFDLPRHYSIKRFVNLTREEKLKRILCQTK